ncbi:tumor necrosis factor [Athene noctua]|uniref:tumor necrosis factor n=1 Tax=Athene noctua TaxID=126797 RepID=UPI003EBA583A
MRPPETAAGPPETAMGPLETATGALETAMRPPRNTGWGGAWACGPGAGPSVTARPPGAIKGPGGAGGGSEPWTGPPRPPPRHPPAPRRGLGGASGVTGVAGVTGVTGVTVALLLLLLLPRGAAARLRPPDPPEAPTAPALGGVPGGPELPQAPRGDKPAAHVVASSSSSSSPGGLVWDAGVAPSVVRNGVRLRGNRLVVPRDGLYFVYAAAAFQGGRCPPPRAPAPQILRLSVSRFSEEYPRDVPLLSAVRSVCGGGGGRRRRRRRRRRRDEEDEDEEEEEEGGRGEEGRHLWFESLYQGAVFQLRRGDQLAATTTAGRFLDLHGGGQAYFGVVGVD